MNTEFKEGMVVRIKKDHEIIGGLLVSIRKIKDNSAHILFANGREGMIELDHLELPVSFTDLSPEKRKEFIVKIADQLYSYPNAYGYYLANQENIQEQIEQTKINTPI